MGAKILKKVFIKVLQVLGFPFKKGSQLKLNLFNGPHEEAL